MEYVRVNDWTAAAQRTGVEVPADEDRCTRIEQGQRCPHRRQSPRGKQHRRAKYCNACRKEAVYASMLRRREKWKRTDPEGYAAALERARAVRQARYEAGDPLVVAAWERNKMAKRRQHAWLKADPERHADWRRRMREAKRRERARKKEAA